MAPEEPIIPDTMPIIIKLISLKKKLRLTVVGLSIIFTVKSL